MNAKNKLWEWCLRLEHHLCPDFCGVVDRRRVIAFVLLSLIEIFIIPYHFILFYILNAWVGFYYNLAHTLVLALLLYLVLTRKVAFKNGISMLYVLVFVKLAVDSMLCLRFGAKQDNLSVMSNIFIMFILAITAESQQLHKTRIGLTIALLPIVAVAISHTQFYVLLFSGKAILVGFLMVFYVSLYNMDHVITKELRQPKILKDGEKKALNMLADLKDNQPEAAESLMKRLTPDVRQKIITHASEHLFNEELDRVAWDQVCDGLTFSEKEICKLILQGHTLKEICAKFNKSESNITSQRCHIRKKLNMDRRDDLRRTLEVRFYDAQKQVKKSEAENS